MRKLIAGFLLGVIATIAATYLLDNNSVEMQKTSTGQVSVTKDSVSEERGKRQNRSGEKNVDDGEEISNALLGKSAASPEPSALQTKPDDTLQPDAIAISKTQALPAKTPNNEYPPEIADMIEKSVPKDLQARYESDEREESWATYMEGQLAAYFAQKPALAQFNFSLIDCRTSICEIHALGYGPDAFPIWNAATADITRQPWHDFNRMSVSNNNSQPDILAIVLILAKNGN